MKKKKKNAHVHMHTCTNIQHTNICMLDPQQVSPTSGVTGKELVKELFLCKSFIADNLETNIYI